MTSARVTAMPATVLLALLSIVGIGNAMLADLTIGAGEFNQIRLCAPFNIVVLPGYDGSDYFVRVNASSNVQSAIDARVSNKVLSIVTTKDLSTTEPIQVIVTIPAGRLTGVQVTAPQAIVTVDGVTAASSFNASHVGSGGILMLGFNVSDLAVSLVGDAKIYANGTVGDVLINSTGSGSVGINGLQGSAQVAMVGNSNVYIIPSGGVFWVYR